MSARATTLKPLDVEDVPEVSASDVPETAGESCGCPRCGLYKWYPPLLLLSTIMAGVFCWMYVTKPVFLSQPQELQPADSQQSPPASTPGIEPDEWAPPIAEAEGALDPAIAGLPGEAPQQLTGTSGIFEGGMQPLVVNRSEGSLFKPFVVPNEGSAIPPKDALATSVLSEGGSSIDDSPASPPDSIKSSDGSWLMAGGDPDLSSVSADQDYRIGSSFMTEFLADEPEEGAATASPTDTAMR